MSPKSIQSRLADPKRGPGKHRCPCCKGYMKPPSILEGGHQRKYWRTKGHLRPAMYTGGYRFWIWQCAGCNLDQGSLSIWEWHTILKGRTDFRHVHVETLLRTLEVDFGIKEDIHASLEQDHASDWDQHRASNDANEEK